MVADCPGHLQRRFPVARSAFGPLVMLVGKKILTQNCYPHTGIYVDN